MHLRFRLFCLFWVLLCPTFGQAASVLNFPRLSFEDSRLIGVAIANPTDQTANLTVTAYGPDGTPLSAPGFTNPVPVSLPPGQQYAKLTSEIFGAFPTKSQVAWFQVTSPVDGLTGFFAYLFVRPDGKITELDGADLPVVGGNLIFNRIQIGGGLKTEVDIINIHTEAQALVTLELVQPDGLVLPQSATIPALGIARVDVGSLFQVAQVPPGTYLRVRSQVPVAGYQMVFSPTGDALALNAKSGNELLKVIYFPQMAVLGPWKTEIGIVNYRDAAEIVTLTAYRPDGKTYGAAELQNNPVIRNLPPNGSLQEDVASLFGFKGTNILDGWVKVEATSASINGYISYGIPASGSVATVAGAPEGRTRALFSHLATTLGYFTGVAVLNPSTLPVNIRILALRPNGGLIGSFDGVVRPGQRLSKLINELVPEAVNQGGGLIWIKSDAPVFLTSIFGTADVLANIPPQQVGQAYQPDQNQAALKVTPPLAIVQPGKPQAFKVQGGSGFSWRVNGIPGGNSTLGTIDQQGNYTAPAAVPAELPLTVSAEAANKAAAASVDVLTKESLVQNLGVVQSIAYLAGLQKLFAAEVSGLAPADSWLPAASPAAVNSQIVEVAPGIPKVLLVNLPGDAISKMIPFSPSAGGDFLLVAAKTSGRVLRVHAGTKEIKEIATGLDQPSALVIDPASGDLLVAEKTRISQIPRFQLIDPQAGFSGRDLLAADRSTYQAVVSSQFPINGITVDACSGRIYFTEGDSLRVFDRLTGTAQTLVQGLRNPGQLLDVYRSGVSCPNSIQILLINPGLPGVSLFTPDNGNLVPWTTAQGLSDLIALPADNPFRIRGSILLSEADNGAINRVDTAGLYAPEAPNRPVLNPIGEYSDPVGDAVIAGEIRNPADIISVSALRVRTNLNLTVRFAHPITPPNETGQGLNSWAYLDLDPGDFSGFDVSFNGMFIDGFAFLLPGNQALVGIFEFNNGELVNVGVEQVPVTYSERSYTLTIPSALLEGSSRIGVWVAAWSAEAEGTGISFDWAPDDTLLLTGAQ